LTSYSDDAMVNLKSLPQEQATTSTNASTRLCIEKAREKTKVVIQGRQKEVNKS